jgi:hypothetical protein
MKHVGAPLIDDRMPGVGPALIAHNHVGIFGQDIDDLALAFIPPLRADNDKITHC